MILVKVEKPRTRRGGSLAFDINALEGRRILAAVQRLGASERAESQAARPTQAARSPQASPTMVAPGYDDGTKAPLEIKGARAFFGDYYEHRPAPRRRFLVSGGMWEGLSVVPLSNRRLRVLFRGRSTGRTVRRAGSKRRGYVYKARRVSNALKAGAVASSPQNRAALFSISARDLAAFTADLVSGVAESLDLGVEWQSVPPPPPPPAGGSLPPIVRST